MGLLDSQTAPADLLSPAAADPAQKWANALAVMSAGLKDAGAYLQHDPGAAGNVAALAAARQRRAQNAVDPANYLNLLAALARLSGASRPMNVPGVPLPNGAPPAAAPLQPDPAPMLQPQQQLQPNAIPGAQPMPGQVSGWAVQKVR
ncbi:MAG TPA: hypothetical protein VFW28_01255 [Micropepsaceae bacterium]|nr:hypothetical protein [Micropepsaceae bacterium]